MPLRISLAAALFGLVLLSSPAHAQRPGGAAGAIVGVIVDAETGETLPSATAALYAEPDSAFVTGAAADLDGAFRVEPVPAGAYQVRLSFLGYETLRLRGVAVAAGQTTALDTLRLAPDASLLDGAEVVGRREAVEQRADRTVYNVADQSVTAGASALETLQTLPAIEVDTEGAISLRGNQNVVVQINGRPVPIRGAQLAALLRQIPAGRVDRVEVLPNPSARFDADGMSGIVNIVLVEGTDRGLSGGLTLGGGTLPTADIGGNVAYQAGPWDVYASYGYRYDQFDLVGTTDRLVAGTGLQIGQDLTNRRAGQSHFATTSATYTLSPSTSLAFEGSAGGRLGDTDNRLLNLNAIGTAPATRTERLTDGSFGGLNLDGALVLRRSFSTAAPTAQGGPAAGGGGPRGGGGMGGFGGGGGGRGGSAGGGARGEHELAVEVRASSNADDDDARFTEQLLDVTSVPDLQRQGADNRTDEGILQVDYARPLGGVRVETGFKGIVRRVTSDLLYENDVAGVWTADTARTNAFTYDEGVYAAYVQGAREWGRLGVQAGLRAEAATRDFTLSNAVPALPAGIEVDFTDTSFDYQSLFPSAFATYTFSPGSLVKASYSRRIERPRARRLNPFPSYEDTLSVRIGNPQLRPEYTDAYELTFQYLYFLNVSPFYRRTSDVVRERTLFDAATGVSVQTAQNLDTQDSYGADVTLLGSFLGGRLRGFLSGSVARTIVDGGSAATGVGVDAVSYSARVNVQARVREGTEIQAFGFYRAPQATEDGRVSGFGIATLGLSQRFSPALSLSVRVNDLFSTSRFAFSSISEQGTLEGVRDPAQRQVSATLTYTFGAGQPRQQRQQEPQQDSGFSL